LALGLAAGPLNNYYPLFIHLLIYNTSSLGWVVFQDFLKCADAGGLKVEIGPPDHVSNKTG
jgi:hypothetical protein